MFFDQSRIYQEALDLVEVSREVVDDLPPGFGFLSDQLRRAVASVPLNFAEGSGKESKRDRRKFFMIARGSVYEVAAALDVGERLGVVTSERREGGRRICDRIAGMLTKFR